MESSYRWLLACHWSPVQDEVIIQSWSRMGAESADYESGGDHDDYDDHLDRDKPRPVCVSE